MPVGILDDRQDFAGHAESGQVEDASESSARHKGAGSDDTTVRVDVGTAVEERIDCVDIVGAGCPVQRCLLVRPAETCVHLSASTDKSLDDFADVREMTGPVGHDVKQGAARPVGIVVAQSCGGQVGTGSQMLS